MGPKPNEPSDQCLLFSRFWLPFWIMLRMMEGVSNLLEGKDADGEDIDEAGGRQENKSG